MLYNILGCIIKLYIVHHLCEKSRTCNNLIPQRLMGSLVFMLLLLDAVFMMFYITNNKLFEAHLINLVEQYGGQFIS